MDRSSRQREATERRAAFRFPVSGARRDGELRTPTAQFPVTILDESAGGYSVEYEHAQSCHVGDVLHLRVETDWYTVRVRFLEVQEFDAFDGSGPQSLTRLGLMRLTEQDLLGLANENLVIDPWDSLRRKKLNVRKNGMIAAAASMLAGLVIVGFFVTHRTRHSAALSGDDSTGAGIQLKKSLELAPKLRLPSDEQARKGLREIDRHLPAAPALPRLPDAAPSGQQAGKLADKLGGPPKLNLPELPEDLANRPERVGRRILEEGEKRLPPIHFTAEQLHAAQPDFLLRPEVCERLRLSHTQQLQLRRLELEQRTADQSAVPKELAAESHTVAQGRRALQVLSRDQQIALVALLAEREARETASEPTDAPPTGTLPTLAPPGAPLTSPSSEIAPAAGSAAQR